MSRTGIIFDFDGTIALSEPVHMAAWTALAREEARALPAGFLEKGVGASDAELVEDLAAAWGDGPPAELLLLRKRHLYQTRCAADSVLVPGVVAALTDLGSRYPLALATSASRDDIAPTLARFDLARFFRVTLTIESVRHPKPDPEIYLAAAARLGVAPESSFAFEDSPPGAAAARAAGMQVIGLTTTFPPGGIGTVLASIDDYRELERLRALIG